MTFTLSCKDPQVLEQVCHGGGHLLCYRCAFCHSCEKPTTFEQILDSRASVETPEILPATFLKDSVFTGQALARG